MALFFVRMPPAKVENGFNYSNWYQKNKKALSEKRAKKYATNAQFRNAALERSRNQREKTVKVVVNTEGFDVSLSQAANQLGISIWVLREWRKKSYFPEPRFQAGKLWFKDYQVSLLSRLKDFFSTHGVRTSAVDRNDLNDLISLTYANW
jgi:hypothetical protein